MLTSSFPDTACTSVVTQVSWNWDSENIAADVEFLTKVEWVEELAILLSDFADQANKGVQHPNQLNGVGATAWAKVHTALLPSGLPGLTVHPDPQIHAVYTNVSLQTLVDMNADMLLQKFPREYL